MPTEQEISAKLADIQKELPGFIAASLVDLDSGMTLGARSTRKDFDLNTASAFNSEMVKQKLKIMQALKLDSELEDMLLTLTDQIHLIKMVTPGTFVYLAAERAGSNIAIVRNAVNNHVDALR